MGRCENEGIAMKKESNAKIYIILHLLLVAFSLNGIFSKFAASEDFLSIKFILCYGVVILILGIYAIGWQQIIKRLPLTTAFANKAITVVWGIIWGAIFFKEQITLGKIIGGVIVILGVILYVKADEEVEHE